MSTSGHVLALHRWPVKSFRGETLDALDLDDRGVPGDRSHAVWLTGDRRATARLVPGLLRWSARLEPDRMVARVSAPDGRSFGWEDPALPGALCEDLGREVAVVRDLQGMQDLPRSVLVTLEATRAGLEAELATTVDLRRFRPNVHVAVDAPPFAEAGWEGRRLRIGAAELELLHPCLRCSIVARDPETNAKSPAVLRRLVREHGGIFGINARPLAPATIRVGDPVEVA